KSERAWSNSYPSECAGDVYGADFVLQHGIELADAWATGGVSLDLVGDHLSWGRTEPNITYDVLLPGHIALLGGIVCVVAVVQYHVEDERGALHDAAAVGRGRNAAYARCTRL